MKALGLIAVLLLSGCAAAPYIEGGIGYSGETGDYFGEPNLQSDISETGVSGYLAVGIEFEQRWYLPSRCEVMHRSMVNKKPEIEVDDLRCMKRIYLWRKR